MGTITVLETSAGTATLNVRVTGSTTDNNSANDTASASATVTGTTYNLQPALTSISPNAIRSGTSDTTITLTGINFAAGSTVMLGTTALTTTYASGTQLAAIVPAASLASMTWAPVSVSSPTPGSGSSDAVPSPSTVCWRWASTAWCMTRIASDRWPRSRPGRLP